MAEGMTILSTVYASAPVDQIIIGTLEIRVAGLDPLRVSADYESHLLGVDGVMVEFEAGPLSIALPSRDTRGNQTLKFGISGVSGRAQRYVDAALASGEPASMIYREYLASDTTEPARQPVTMTIVGGSFEGVDAVFEGSYFDLLNASWPRERYTSITAPGIRYL